MKKIIKKPLVFIYTSGLKMFGGLGLQKVWPLGAIRDWLSGVVRTYGKPASVVFEGQTIFLDPNDNLELSVWGEHHAASHDIELMKRMVKSGDTVVDVGANIGLMTVFMAQIVGKAGHVFAFEPAPDNVGLLKKNIAANKHENVTVAPVAVSDRAGMLKLYLSDFNPGDHRIYDPEEKTKDWEKNGAVYDRLIAKRRTAIDVPVVSLDDHLKDWKNPIALIKIDVQGAEGGVLKGMTGILKKNKSVKIMTEFWPAALKMFGTSAEEYLQSLSDLGFIFFEIDDKAGVGESPVSVSYLLKTYTVENNLTTNLLVSRKSNRE